jgi:hypothetical protein
MSCRDVQNRLHDYMEQTLPEPQRRQVEAHLKACSNCRQELSDMKASLVLIQNLDEVDPPPFLASRIMAEVRETSQKQSWLKRIIFAPVRIPVGALAAFLILFSLLHVYTVWMPGESMDKAPMISENTAPRLPDHLLDQVQPPGPNEILANHSLQNTTAQQFPDLQLTMRVKKIDPIAKEVLRRLLAMDSRILSLEANAGVYHIMTDIDTEDKKELIQFLEHIDPNAEVTGGLSSQEKTLVSVVLLRKP